MYDLSLKMTKDVRKPEVTPEDGTMTCKDWTIQDYVKCIDDNMSKMSENMSCQITPMFRLKQDQGLPMCTQPEDIERMLK